jgi:hypothetical protein
MKTKHIIASLLILFVLPKLSATEYDCSFCTHSGSLRDETGYPYCQVVLFSDNVPSCEDLGDCSVDVALASPKDCYWVLNIYVHIAWELWACPADDETQTCTNEDWQLIHSSVFDAQECGDEGYCLIEV